MKDQSRPLGKAVRLLARAAVGIAAIAGPAANAALTLSANANVDTVSPSELVNLELTVTNTDVFARNGVIITMQHPANLNTTFESEFDGDCASTTCTTGETITWTIGSLPAGAARTVDMPAVVSANAANGAQLVFEPAVTDDSMDSDTDSTVLTIESANPYDLTVSENADPAIAGTELIYTITFGHLSSAPGVNNTTLNFPLPANTSFVSASDGGSASGSNVQWPLGFLSPGDSGVRQVTVALDAGLISGSIINATAQLVSSTNAGQAFGASADTVVASSTPLGLAIEAAVNPLRASELGNLLLTVSNNDSFTRFDVLLQGRTPQSINTLFETEFEGDCGSTTCTAGERITWTLGDIPAGGTVTVDLLPVINSTSVDGRLVNWFLSASDGAGAHARQTQSLRVQSDTLYDLSVSEDADPVTPGRRMTYTLNFSLRGDATVVNNTTLALPLPAGLSFVSATDGGSVNAGVVEWPLGFLSPGESGIRKVTVEVDNAADPGSVIQSTAKLHSLTTPIERITAQAHTVVATSMPLEIAIEANPNPARPAETTEIRFIVTNNDAFTHFGVNLIARYPQSLATLFESEFDGDCGSTTCTAQEEVVWQLGNLAAGQSVSVDMNPNIASPQTDGTLINLFTRVRDDQVSSARRMQTIHVDTATEYDLSLAESADPALAGTTLNYKLTYGYRGDAAAVSQSMLQFPLPDGVSFVSATGGGTLNNGVVEWPLGFMSPGDGGIREVTVAIDAALAAGEVIEAQATLRSFATPNRFLQAEADTAIAATAPLGLHIELDPATARNGQSTNVQLTVSNNDVFTRFDMLLSVRVPQATNTVFETEFDGDCGSTTCTAGERVTWLLGDLPAGGSSTVDLPLVIAGTAIDSALVNLFAFAQDGQGTQARRLNTVRPQGDTIYDLALAEAADPAMPGSQIEYQLTFSLRDDAPATTDSNLRFNVPPGTTFVSASDGGLLNGDTVQWNLGFLSPGDGDLRTVTVAAGAGLAAGTVVEVSADIVNASGSESLRTEAHTTLLGSVPLSLEIVPNRNNAEAGAPLTHFLNLTNNDPFTRFDVIINSRFPQGLQTLFETEFEGQCGSTTCTAGELITWNVGDIPAQGSVTVVLPTTVSGTQIDGTIIDFFAWASDGQDAQARDLQSMLLGCLDAIDADCDGISDTLDNCLQTANLQQRDTDMDGIGNACDPDIFVPNDCQVNFLDLGTMKAAFFSGPADANWNPDADLDGDNSVNFIDLGAMKSGFFAAPGPSGMANACD